MAQPRVCVLHVGGTIGMTASPAGLEPRSGLLESYLATMPELARADVPSHRVESLDPLLDSADMTPSDWVRIAQAIIERDAEYAGFVVLHGTDTLVHTASALSFLLPGLRKPVVLTGSQLSLQHVRSDGREHIITSLLIAGTLAIPEVCIYFGGRLLRGNRTQKLHANDFVAFKSGRLPPLARVGARIEVNHRLIRPAGAGLPSTVGLVREPQVAALRVFPGMTRNVLEHVFDGGLDGLVLETYGAGTFPSRDAGLLEPMRAATARDSPVVVVNCTQCLGGRVQQDLYRSSRALAAAGVISGHDMTPEAALTKLYCLFGSGMSAQAVRDAMSRDLAGELEPGDG